jgi:hypothetical protein
MPVLREGGMIGDIAVEPEPAEPPVRQIEVDLFAEAPLGADTEAIPDDQHADLQAARDHSGGRGVPAAQRGRLSDDQRVVHRAVLVLSRHVSRPF